jgi:hypothetical protein
MLLYKERCTREYLCTSWFSLVFLVVVSLLIEGGSNLL